jgi:hypothetical protein
MSNTYFPSPLRQKRVEADNRERRHGQVRTGYRRRGNTLRKVPKRQFARKPAVHVCSANSRQKNTVSQGALS